MDWVSLLKNILSYLSGWYVVTFLASWFLTYYLREVVKKPALACSSGKFKQFLEEHVPLLKEKYWPTLWCFESRAQTIFANILRSMCLPDVSYRREILCLSDGGEVGLDWMEEGCKAKSPIIIILPGLTGCSQDDYVKCTVLAANRIGVRTVVFNNRGLGGVAFKTPRTYCAANAEDVSEVIHHVKNNNPGIQLAATGISMGGMVLGHYLSSEGVKAREMLTAAMLISVPWNAARGVENLEKPLINLLLNKHLVRGLCSIVKRWQHQVNEKSPDVEEVFKSKTLRQFDSVFTSKQFGYKNVEDYYIHSSIDSKLDKIAVPLLCLNAADDPFQPFDAIPVDAANKSPNVAIVVTARGGHIGFMEGFVPSLEGQYMSRLFCQFFGAVFHDKTSFSSVIEKTD